jgi:uncharacterized protein
LTLVVSRLDAVVGSSFVAFVTQAWMALVLRREADHATVKRMLPASLLGMPIGILIGHVVSDRVLRIAVGLAVLVAVVAIHRGLTVVGKPRIVDRVAGFVSGILGTTTGTNGPPLVIALAGRGLSPGVTRATLTMLFSFANIVSLALFAVDGSVSRATLVVAAIGVVPALVVRAAAESTFRKLDAARYRSLVLGLLTVAGLVAIVNAFR